MSATLIPEACSAPTAAGTTVKRHRRHARRVHRAPCVIRVVTSEIITNGGEALGARRVASGAVSGRTVNISASGVAIQLGEQLKIGTEVEVMLAQAGDGISSVFGRVVHSRRVQAGAFEIGVSIGDGG